MADEPGDLPRALPANYSEFPNSCLWVELPFFEDVPEVLVDVERPLHVRVRGRDENGDEVVVEATGLEARVIQHEIDHLDGVLILDRTTREQRKEAVRSLREAQAAA